jgi:hypothetical protein
VILLPCPLCKSPSVDIIIKKSVSCKCKSCGTQGKKLKIDESLGCVLSRCIRAWNRRDLPFVSKL